MSYSLGVPSILRTGRNRTVDIVFVVHMGETTLGVYLCTYLCVQGTNVTL